MINNAGISGVGVFEQWDDDEIDAIFDTNVYGVIRVTQEVLPIMRKQGEGMIINISSLAGIIGSPFASIYSAAKFAIEGLTEALALEYAPFNIGVKVIAPGAYDTNLFSSISNRILSNGDNQIRAYSKKMNQKMNVSTEQMSKHEVQGSNPQDVADKVYLCVTQNTPIHNVSGSDAEHLSRLKKTMPEKELMGIITDMLVPTR
ncbi:hypothetical protein NBRC116583_08440 [Arenicella sp. 4NH20-0111]|uniref:SDR family NAD(P)-dependent oxidoreductase n=1 Tax=Arenicella sp. 4NH20-0111 TaxID=3127648 RepID=UPI0031049425